MRLARPNVVIDIMHLKNLAGSRSRRTAIRIGAGVARPS